MNFSDLTRKRSISNENGRSNVHSLWQRFVGASNLLGISFNGVVSADLQLLTGNKLDWFIISQHSGSNFGSLGIKHDSHLLVRSLLQSFLQILDTLPMRLMIAMGEI